MINYCNCMRMATSLLSVVEPHTGKADGGDWLGSRRASGSLEVTCSRADRKREQQKILKSFLKSREDKVISFKTSFKQ